MKRIKRIIRIIGFACLIALAGIGMGLSGGVPIPVMKRRKDPSEEQTELVEKKQDEDESEKSIG